MFSLKVPLNKKTSCWTIPIFFLKDVKVTCVLSEEKPNCYKASFRSKVVDVCAIAKIFGGFSTIVIPLQCTIKVVHYDSKLLTQ